MKILNDYLLKKVNKKRIDLIKYFDAKGYQSRQIDCLLAPKSNKYFAEYFGIREKDYVFLAQRFNEIKSGEYFFSNEGYLATDILNQILLKFDHGK